MLYHCSHRNFTENELIFPGNWGKILFDIGPQHQCWKRETMLEAVRAWEFPDKPSRLKSTFACDDLNTMKCFRDQQCPKGFIYEVEIVIKDAVIHRGDFNAVQPMPNFPDGMLQIAYKYWDYKIKTTIAEWPGVVCSELVIGSPLKVSRLLNL